MVFVIIIMKWFCLCCYDSELHASATELTNINLPKSTNPARSKTKLTLYHSKLVVVTVVFHMIFYLP